MALDRHKREIHNAAKEYPCELCDHISGNKGDMKKHQELCHSDNWWPKSSTSKESSEESDDCPVLDDEIETQVDINEAKTSDSGAANQVGYEVNINDENATDSLKAHDIGGKTNAPGDIPRDIADLSKNFIVKQGKASNPMRIQCGSCPMLFAIKKGDYSGFIYHMDKKHNVSFKKHNSPSGNVEAKSADDYTL